MRVQAGHHHLMCGDETILTTEALILTGRQNWQNALAVIALADCMGLERTAIIDGLKTFNGLAHRTELIRKHKDVVWVNDSKGTNVGATIAAIEGVAPTVNGRVVVLLGGLGKGADFLPLAASAKAHCTLAIIYGEDGDLIARACDACEMPYELVPDLSQAIKVAYNETKAGDMVLFSPACASFDMFDNFVARGNFFKEEVLKLK